jgi:hypothetical protein
MNELEVSNRSGEITVKASTKRSIAVACLIFVAYLVLACLAFWPISPLDATRLPDGAIGDPTEMTWFLSYSPWALFHAHNIWLTHAIDVPSGVNLASNTSVPLLGLLSAPIHFLFGPIATYNAMLRLALGLSATATCLVFRRWCKGWIGPVLGGLLVAFSPALASHLQAYGHLDLVFVALIPILLWLINEVVVDQRHSAVRFGVLIGLAAAGEYLISAELFADCVLVGALGVALVAATHPSEIASHLRHSALALSTAGVVFLVIAGYPLAIALIGPGHLNGPVQPTAHLQRFRIDLLEPLVPDARLWLFPSRLAAVSKQVLQPVHHAGGAAELDGYLGAPLIITTCVTAIALRRRGIVVVAFALAVASFIASLGSRLQIDGHFTSIPLPEVVLAKLPLLDSEVPARFAIFTTLFLALVVAICADELVIRARSSFSSRGTRPIRGWLTNTSVVALGVIGVASSLVAAAPRLPLSNEQVAETTPVVDAIHALVPNGATVLAYPYPVPPNSVAMVWQAEDDFRFNLLGGYANVRASNGAGQIFPLLQQPAYVQEFLAFSESGKHAHYLPPEQVTSPSRALCRFISADHVTSVLYLPYGPGTAAVFSLFEAALGTPTRRAGVAFWGANATNACGVSKPG